MADLLSGVLCALVAAGPATDAPTLATFEAEGSALSDLTMVCDASENGKVRCNFTQGAVEIENGVCSFSTFKFSYLFERKAPYRWVHVETTPCDTQLVAELVGTPSSKGSNVLHWSYSQVRNGTPINSEQCRIFNVSRPLTFVPGGGSKHPARCDAVKMKLGG